MKKLALILLLSLLSLSAWAQNNSILPAGGIGVSCNAVTTATSANPGASGACISFNWVGSAPSIYSWQVITTGSPGSIVVNFMGSLDGLTWTQIDTTTATGIRTVGPLAYRFVGCVPATLSGGSSPTITCQISSSGGISTTTVLFPASAASASLVGPFELFTCSTTCTITPPTPVVGFQFCVRNDDNVATVITLAAISGVQYETTARTSYKTANTSFVSGGTVTDQICIVGKDSTHYQVWSFTGTWT